MAFRRFNQLCCALIVQPEAREQARQILYRLARIQVLATIVVWAYLIIFRDPVNSAVSVLLSEQLPAITNVIGWGGIVIGGLWCIEIVIFVVKCQRYVRIAVAPTLDESLDRQQRYTNNNDYT